MKGRDREFGTSFHFTRGQYRGLGGSLLILAILSQFGVNADFLIFYIIFWIAALGWCMNINEARGT